MDYAEEGRPTPSLAAAAEEPGQHHATENSTPYLQQRLQQLKTQSHELSTELTKRLATSRSGQSLLHIGPSLSTLPPDLSSLIDALTPLLGEVQNYESLNRCELERLVGEGQSVQTAIRKREFAVECAEIYSDLVGAEEVLRKDVERRDGGRLHARLDTEDGLFSEEDEGKLISPHSSAQVRFPSLTLCTVLYEKRAGPRHLVGKGGVHDPPPASGAAVKLRGGFGRDLHAAETHAG